MLFLRIFQHLLPDAAAWRISVTKTLRQFFEGLAGFFSGTRDFIDAVLLDAFPETTRELSGWESQFGLTAVAAEVDRRANIGATWAARGGQSKSYIEGVLASFGFNITVHEWWASGPPFVARDPRPWINQPSTGLEPGYLVNKGPIGVGQPAVPDDPAKWPYFIYVGGPLFLEPARVLASRQLELERELLKLRPAQQWIVKRISYQRDLNRSEFGRSIAGSAIAEDAFGA